MQSAPAVFLASYPDAEPGPCASRFSVRQRVGRDPLAGCDRSPIPAYRDAMLLALDHDRFCHDGRLRNGYLAGAVGAAPLKLAAVEQPRSTLARG